MDKLLDIEFIRQAWGFTKYFVNELKWFAFIPVGGALLIMFIVNLLLKKVDKSKAKLDLATLRKSFEFIISFPLAFGIYCLTAVCMKLDPPYLEQLPGMLVLGLAVQLIYVVLNRVIFALFKFVINSVKKSLHKDK